MWKTIKSWFTGPPAPLTLEQKHAQALRKADAAVSGFKFAAAQLEVASENLRAVSIESSDIARAHQARANEALAEAEAELRRSEKIKELFG